jgi:hypothetical protein
VKIVEPLNSSSMSSNQGIEKAIANGNVVYGSTINTHTPSTIFLGTKITRTAQGLRLSRTYPLSNNYWTCC